MLVSSIIAYLELIVNKKATEVAFLILLFVKLFVSFGLRE